MSETNIFERASRIGLTFNTSIGVLAVSDLWNLKLETLDVIAGGLRKALQEEEVSFLTPKRSNEETQLRFDIALHVINVRLEEKEEAKARADKAIKRQKILELLASKQDAALAAKSEEELLAELEAL